VGGDDDPRLLRPKVEENRDWLRKKGRENGITDQLDVPFNELKEVAASFLREFQICPTR